MANAEADAWVTDALGLDLVQARQAALAASGGPAGEPDEAPGHGGNGAARPPTAYAGGDDLDVPVPAAYSEPARPPTAYAGDDEDSLRGPPRPTAYSEPGRPPTAHAGDNEDALRGPPPRTAYSEPAEPAPDADDDEGRLEPRRRRAARPAPIPQPGANGNLAARAAPAPVAAPVPAAAPPPVAAPAANGAPPARKAWPTVEAPPPVPGAASTGMKAKNVDGAFYQGEHNTLGPRAANAAYKAFGIGADETRVTTALYTPEQVAANKLVSQEDGSYRKGDGSEVKNDTLGYAMDPQTGDMSTFKDGQDILRPAADGTMTRTPASSHDEIAFEVMMNPESRAEFRHHSSVLGGDEAKNADGETELDADGRPIMKSRKAASAGFVKFDDKGKIIDISNNSGHYKPAVDYLMQAVEFLTKQGAFFQGKITDVDGNALDENGDKYKLYQTVQEKMKDLPALASQVEELQEQLAAAGEGDAAEAIGGQIAALKPKLDAITNGVTMLRKLGIGPDQKIRADATATFKDINSKMTGFGVRMAPDRSMPVEDFLKTGGGNMAQADLKSAMQRELHAKISRNNGAPSNHAEDPSSLGVGELFQSEDGNKAPRKTIADLEAEDELRRKAPGEEIDEDEQSEALANRQKRAETRAAEALKPKLPGEAPERPPAADAPPEAPPSDEDVAAALAALTGAAAPAQPHPSGA
jgi:hypothetical protein